MGSLLLRLSDDLHAAVKRAASPQSANAWIREAIAEKLGRAALTREIEELRDRVEALERRIAGRLP